jgi:NADH-dependent peroxiredoxin subunit C
MTRIGQKIDDFAFDVYLGDKIKQVTFSTYKGKWLILLFSPVGSAELDEATAYYDRFTKGGAEILAVSMNRDSAHKARHCDSSSMKRIAFPIAADSSAKLCRYFGTYIEDTGISLRGAFIIDPDGVLRARTIKRGSVGRSGDGIFGKHE